MRLFLLALALTLTTLGCDDDPETTDGDADADADSDGDSDGDGDGDGDADADEEVDADAGPTPTCADLTQRLMIPSPTWHGEDGLVAPAGDLAGALLQDRRPTWYDQLPGLDGWPARPVIILALAGIASSANGLAVSAFGHPEDGGDLILLDSSFSAELVDEGRGVLLRPNLPFPAEFAEVTLAIGADIVTHAVVLPACGSDGETDPAHATALAALPAGWDTALALSFPISQISHQLRRLWTRLQAEPDLNVSDFEIVALEDFGEAAPAPEIAAHLQEGAFVGRLDLPDYRDENGVFVIGADGIPESTSTTRPGFVVALPNTGEPPYPVVLFQHGGGQSPTHIFQVAGALAEAGFAFVAIDLPRHGERAAPGGRSDLDVIDFLDPFYTRDNLRQASADHLAVLSGLDDLDLAVGEPIGVSDVFDNGRLFYMGLSLGGITGSMTVATATTIRGGALFVAAADYSLIVSDGLFSVFMADVLSLPDVERALMLGFLEAFLDPADPGTYARRLEDRSAPARPVVLMQAVDDPLIPMPSSDYWGRTFGASLARPYHHEVPGMTSVDLPAAGNFSWPGSADTATRLLIQAPMAGAAMGDRHGGLILQDYSQQLVAHCFDTLLESGSCEVIDTGFGEI